MAAHYTSTETEPRARGREFGLAHAPKIRATIAAYQDLFDQAHGAAVNLDDWGTLALERITALSKALGAELAGMAEGADVPLAALAAINARTEILAAVGVHPAKECSSVVRLVENGPPIAVQAWDWYAQLNDLWLVWTIPHADGRVTTTLTEYGIVGKIGVNNRGLGVLFNILHHDRDGEGMGVPLHILARAVLDDAKDLNQALVKLAGAAVSASSALTLVACAAGESAAVSVELNPSRVGYALPDASGDLVHTNHFLSTPAAWHDNELTHGPDTVVRLDLIKRKLARTDPTGVDATVRALDSHLLGGGSTCCHVDPELPPESAFATLAVVSLDVENGTLFAHDGGACTYPTTP